MIRLALDMMGSDLGPKELAKGVALFQEKYGAECQLILVGKKEELPESGFEIEDAREVLPMETGAMEALRAKNSSMHRAVRVSTPQSSTTASTARIGSRLAATTV